MAHSSANEFLEVIVDASKRIGRMAEIGIETVLPLSCVGIDAKEYLSSENSVKRQKKRLLDRFIEDKEVASFMDESLALERRMSFISRSDPSLAEAAMEQSPGLIACLGKNREALSRLFKGMVIERFSGAKAVLASEMDSLTGTGLEVMVDPMDHLTDAYLRVYFRARDEIFLRAYFEKRGIDESRKHHFRRRYFEKRNGMMLSMPWIDELSAYSVQASVWMDGRFVAAVVHSPVLGKSWCASKDCRPHVIEEGLSYRVGRRGSLSVEILPLEGQFDYTMDLIDLMKKAGGQQLPHCLYRRKGKWAVSEFAKGFSYHRGMGGDEFEGVLQRVSGSSHSMKVFSRFSPAIAICAVAEGRAEGFVCGPGISSRLLAPLGILMECEGSAYSFSGETLKLGRVMPDQGFIVLPAASRDPLPMDGYDGRFDVVDRIVMARKRIPHEEAVKYPASRSGIEIVDLFQAGIRPKEVEGADPRFGSKDLIRMRREGIDEEDVLRLYAKLESAGRWTSLSKVIDLSRMKVKPEYISPMENPDDARGEGGYADRFECFDVRRFKEKGISPDVANSYEGRFRSSEILIFHGAGISNERARSYPSRFDGFQICDLIESHVPPGIAAGFARRFSSSDIISLFRAKIPPKKARAYPERIEGSEIVTLVNHNVSARRAKEYDPRFSGMDLASLAMKSISPDVANSYNPRFSALDIILLRSKGIDGPYSIPELARLRAGLVQGIL